MMGSGIYSEELTVNGACKNEDCEEEFEDVDVMTNDDGGYYVTCKKCDSTSEYDGE